MNRFLSPLSRAAAAAVVIGVSATLGAAPRAVAEFGARPSSAAGAGSLPVSIGAQVAGTVIRVGAKPGGYVTAGTPLIELTPGRDGRALARARARAAALEARIMAAQAAFAAGRYQAAAGVTAAVGSASTMPPAIAPPPVVIPKPAPATTAQLAEARREIIVARTEVLTDAQAEAASSRRTLDRDRALLTQGLIAAQQLDADAAADQAARAQVQGAQAALHHARAGGPVQAGGIAQAQAAIADAQPSLAAAQADAAAAQQTVDRDSALAAQGAVAAQSVTGDTVTLDAAHARVQAATAELHAAQAELTAARAEAAAAVAVRGQQDAVRRAEAAREQHAEQTWALVRRAGSAIVAVERRARALEALVAQGVRAEADVRRTQASVTETVVRAPADGWVLEPAVATGQVVRPGQPLLTFAVDPRHRRGGAAALRTTDVAAPPPAAGTGRDTLEQIAAGDRRAIAELNTEAARIASISARGIPGIPPPGAVLPYGAPEPFTGSNGAAPTLLNGGMPWPVVGAITSGYGWRLHPIFDTLEFHTGIDIAASMGTPVQAPEAGTVIFAGVLPANGTLVILDHGHGVTTTYSHLSSYRVYAGEHVRRGQVIAQVGSTGWSTGPHLFFEIRQNGHPVNPLGQ